MMSIPSKRAYNAVSRSDTESTPRQVRFRSHEPPGRPESPQRVTGTSGENDELDEDSKPDIGYKKVGPSHVPDLV